MPNASVSSQASWNSYCYNAAMKGLEGRPAAATALEFTWLGHGGLQGCKLSGSRVSRFVAGPGKSTVSGFRGKRLELQLGASGTESAAESVVPKMSDRQGCTGII